MDAIDLLLSRRSAKAAFLTEPAPSAEELQTILNAGMRVPDHGMIMPWRIQVIRRAGQERLADVVEAAFRRANPNAPDAQVAVERQRPLRGPLLLCVTSHPDPTRAQKIPVIEQKLSGGALCQNILLAAHALGYAAQWLTGWPAYDPDIKKALGHDPDTDIIGFIHIGTQAEAQPERPRPEADRIISEWDGA